MEASGSTEDSGIDANIRACTGTGADAGDGAGDLRELVGPFVCAGVDAGVGVGAGTWTGGVEMRMLLSVLAVSGVDVVVGWSHDERGVGNCSCIDSELAKDRLFVLSNLSLTMLAHRVGDLDGTPSDECLRL